MADLIIRVKKNGPYRVEGPVRLMDWDGNEWDLTGKEGGFALCRCGASVSKPFCDGTHSKLGFQAAEAAVRKAEDISEPQPVVGNPPARSPAKG